VIGNPPYGIVFEEKAKPYLESRYPSFVRNNDTYTAFIEKSTTLLRNSGLFGFIVPNTFILGPYYDELKKAILSKTYLRQLIDFGTNRIFKEPNVFTALLFFEKKAIDEGNYVAAIYSRIDDLKSFPKNFTKNDLAISDLKSLKWIPQDPIVGRLISANTNLDHVAWVKDVGLNYWTKGRGKTRGGSIADRVLYEGEQQNPADKPYIKGRDIDRFSISKSNHWLRHNYEKKLDPKIDTLRFSPEFLFREKLVYRQTSDHIVASLDLTNSLTDKTVHVIVLREDFYSKPKLAYLLGLLNSKLLTYVYKKISQEENRTFAQVKTFRMKELPIRTIDFNDPADVQRHDRMVALVESMLALHRQLAAARSPQEKELLQRQIAFTDREIDALVYELYGLTEEEIKIVEGGE
jgi:hypothetical protein